MKKLLEFLVCLILHPVAVVLMWIDLATRQGMSVGLKVVWGVLALIPLVPIIYVLTSGDLW